MIPHISTTAASGQQDQAEQELLDVSYSISVSLYIHMHVRPF